MMTGVRQHLSRCLSASLSLRPSFYVHASHSTSMFIPRTLFHACTHWRAHARSTVSARCRRWTQSMCPVLGWRMSKVEISW